MSDLGRLAEFAGLSTDGAPFCIYPWYSLSTNGFNFGVDYPDTSKDFGQSNEEFYQVIPQSWESRATQSAASSLGTHLQ